MSILSVDNISPIGSGTSVTINNAATLVLNNLNVAGVSTFTGLVDCNGGARIDNLKLGIDTNEEISTQVGNLTLDSASGTVIVSDDLSVTGVSTFSTANDTIGAVIKNTAHDSQLQILATYANKNSVLLFGDAADDDIGKIDYDHNTNNMIFTVDTDEVFRIDSSGRFLKGLTGSGASRSSTSVRYPHFQLSSPWGSGLGSYKIECTDDYPIIFIDSNASYASGSGAGVITWSVKDSSGDYCNTASVRSQIDSTPSNDSAPGRLQFMTTTSGTTPTTKMTIDSGGSVSKPLNPAFYAYLTTNNAVYSAGTIVPWDGTHIDTRSAFQTSGSDQGRFIVPTTGIYYFGWRLNRRNDSRFDLGIFQNGTMKYLDEMRWEGTAGMWMAESGHYLLSCTAGQKIDLRVNSVNNAGSGQFDGGGNGYFDGFFGWMIG